MKQITAKEIKIILNDGKVYRKQDRGNIYYDIHKIQQQMLSEIL